MQVVMVMSARLRDKSLSGNIGDVGFLSMRGRTGLTKLRSLEVLFAELPRHGTTLGHALLLPCQTQLKALVRPCPPNPKWLRTHTKARRFHTAKLSWRPNQQQGLLRSARR